MTTPPRRLAALYGLRAFSLVEAALALGIMALAILSILSLMAVGVTSLKESISDSITSLILQDVKVRLDGTPFPSDAALASGQTTDLAPLFYDKSGLAAVADESEGYPTAVYRVDVTIGPHASPPPNARLAVAAVAIAWPLDRATGAPIGNQRRRFSILVTPATDRGWESASPSYQPKVNQ
ncbi:hypothetical protein DB346_00935 [Verrucomicrobia bacterium LW23]|nr:hypothetical protein DB346_00935 [Verrucomicrobia bacterium LW23]